MSAGLLFVSPKRSRRIMPPWLELMLDVLGFAGFIGLATCMKPPSRNDEPDRS
jgi:hypothetical protein